MEIAKALIKKVLRNMDSDSKAYYKIVNTYYEQVTSISSMLKPRDEKALKKKTIKS